ncbi:hypothetical protein [Pseudomonas knackmussii]|uniref:hypothetical protein n=1 Tax=Pseudomonas knackmussii TaxID=65741 RepID=UPI00136348A4|nr:hypothetical protein [Pseudomonas knackmussii]
MQASNAPGKIQKPFADNGDKQAIPVASQVGVADGRASYTDGFPPLTRTPIVAGGVPPFGTDMNGILNAVTAIQQWQSAGGTFKFDAAFATAIGGYPKGANLQKADGSGTWLCTVENNTSNPDTGGAGWQDFSGGRLLGVQIFTANGTYTPTAGTKSVIIEAVGGGGAGGGAAATSSGQLSTGSGGHGGAYGKGRFTSAFSGVTVTIGAGGTAAAAGANSGGNGGTTSFGALLSCPGGLGGQGCAAATPPFVNGATPAAGTLPSGANIVGMPGQPGVFGFALNTATGPGGGFNGNGGAGGGSMFGAGAHAPNGTGARQGYGYGSASSGAANPQSSSAQASVAGQPGIVIVYEYA